jgi:ATP-dependent Clp protease ATP-binding subunit ClpC
MKNKVTDELKNHFRPEFLNRVDDVIVFPQLTQEEIVAIVDLEIAKLDKRCKDKDMGLELTVTAKNLLAKKGYDPVLGARPLRRTIQREIEDMLSEKILYGELKAGEFVLVDATGEEKDSTFTFTGSLRRRGRWAARCRQWVRERVVRMPPHVGLDGRFERASRRARAARHLPSGHV